MNKTTSPAPSSQVHGQPPRNYGILGFIHRDPWWLLLFGVIATVILMVLTSPTPFGDMLVFIQDGILITVSVTLITFVLVLVLGLVAALARISKNKWLRGAATVYVEIIRGVPLLVQLFFWYFAFPSIIQDVGARTGIAAFQNYKADAISMAIMGLAVCYAAYMSEVYRAGIQSIGRGQMEAARSLGMTYFQAMRYVILPQALRMILPPVGNEFVALLKDSSLVSTVAVADMTRRTREFTAAKFVPVEGWTMLALLYLIMTVFSARVVNWLENKTRMER